MEILMGFIALFIAIIVTIISQNKKEKHDKYYRHSEKYHQQYRTEFPVYGSDKGGDTKKVIKKLIKQVESDPQEMAYINDSIKEETLDQAQKQIKLIEKNKLAYYYVEMIKSLWPDKAARFKRYSKEEIIFTITNRNYKRDPEEIFSDLVESQILLGPLLKASNYGLGIEAIFHPSERDKTGRRIVMLNLTNFSQPNELF
jgi:hypothetical protein